ncbi:glucose-1-phosphate adenylyltransferase [Aliiglaciecola aliphaticivorans]
MSTQQININEILDDTYVVLLAGGQGSRLHELTESRAKPALEFGCTHRIIDFPLSNCANSGLKRIAVVTQYKAQSLIRHLVNGWTNYQRGFNTFLEIMPASQQLNTDWYSGTANALYQNLAFLKSSNAKFILVLSGDHIYKMDYRTLLADHVRSKADMTVSCIEMPKIEAAGKFGVMNVDSCDRIISFEEKPQDPQCLQDSPGNVLASMGNYVFSMDFLTQQLEKDANDVGSQHDFGKDIIPKIIQQSHIHAYRFHTQSDEKEVYWKDVGTIDAYWQANMALLGPHPAAKVNDVHWPIWSNPSCHAPTQIVSDELGRSARIKDSLLANGTFLQFCSISGSLLCTNVRVEEGANLVDSVILPNVTIGKNVRVTRCIIDQNCHIPDGLKIGINMQEDKKRGFRISPKRIRLVTQAMIDNLVSIQQYEHNQSSAQKRTEIDETVNLGPHIVELENEISQRPIL